AYYNTEFFETHDLIIVSIEEGSGSISHEVQSITADENNNWTVAINRNIPLCGTDDMASWVIFIETNKAVESAKSVTIDWVNTYSDEWYQEGILERTVELSKDMQSQEVTGKQADEDFINGQTKFALELFQNEVKTSENNENVMVSGYSVVQAFGMLANGADSDTKTQIEQTIGSMPIEDLNQYLYTQRTTQPNDEKCKLSTANSIWVRDDAERFQPKEEFLQTNANYYNASVFKAPFDDSTVNDINSWVKKNTDDMIPELLGEIPDDAVMYLINAVAFDGKWKESYADSAVRNAIFTTADGSKQTAEMMYSEEYHYLEDENTTGFCKYYDGNRYAFVALLPNEDISINNYIADLTPESFQNLISNTESTSVQVGLPKFSFDYGTELNDTLFTMGIHDAFNNANFSKIADKSLSVSKVRHKTFIDVSETGTRAAAVTSIEMNDGCALIEKSVILDRPFVYAIVDTDTNLPMFMGVLNSVE
ncbi:MAG: serpin family protein, partial [Oscillospiraceae bacterium]|nr:serpin family protein [Oscillospiraceae bacterium]